MIKYISLCLISFSLLIINNKRIGDTLIKYDKQSSFSSCIKLREKLKNLYSSKNLLNQNFQMFLLLEKLTITSKK